MNRTIKIGTRGSKLALYQANKVKNELEEKFQNIKFEIVIIKTKGDKILDVALSKIGDKGLFTKELETELFNKNIDIAVHSLKDLPTQLPKGAKIGAVLERAEVNDAFVSREGKKISELTENDTVATSSLRRKAQLLNLCPNVKVIDIRGNVDTRLRKLDDGYCDALLMAGAGLMRLGFDNRISELIDSSKMIPAVSQGAIAIESRENDNEIDEVILAINHSETYIATKAERCFLRTLEGGCQIPVGCITKIEDDKFNITGFIANIDGTEIIKESATGLLKNADKIATELAEVLLSRGGREILESIRVM